MAYGGLDLDRAVADGVALGPLHGVPCTVKEYTELRCLAVAEAIERRLGTVTPIDPVTG